MYMTVYDLILFIILYVEFQQNRTLVVSRF